MKSKRFVISVVSVTVVSALTAGIAFAVWSATGSGSGAGAAAVAQSLTVIPQTPSGAGASLYPGGPAGPVYFTVQNPNPYPVTITGVSWSSPTSTLTSQCASSNVSIDANAPTTVNLSVPANATSPLLSVAGVLDLAHSAGPGCQGVAFDVVMNVTGTE